MGNGTGKERDPLVDELLEKGSEADLKRLDLRSKNLTQLPPELALLTNLTWLNLPNNMLTEIPEHLCTLKGLQTLRLLGNRRTLCPACPCPFIVCFIFTEFIF